MRFVTRIVLSAIAMLFVFPKITGIEFHGDFFQALCVALLFSIMFWAIDVLAIALSAVAAISTLGLALLWLIPLWVLGFWLLPATALMLVSWILPSVLHVHGLLAASLGGLVLFVIGWITSRTTSMIKRSP